MALLDIPSDRRTDGGDEVGMTDLEKVIKALECCIKSKTESGWCVKCPYYEEETWCTHHEEVYKDAFDLLRSYIPHLLTLDEVQQERTMWLETNNHEWDAMNGIHETVLRTDDDRYDFSDIIVQFVDQDGCDIVCARDRFGIEWRCWSSEPTEEQRGAIPWQNI